MINIAAIAESILREADRIGTQLPSPMTAELAFARLGLSVKDYYGRPRAIRDVLLTARVLTLSFKYAGTDRRSSIAYLREDLAGLRAEIAKY